MRLRRAAVVIPAVKGAIFGVIAATLLVLAFTVNGPGASFLPLAFFLYSFPCLALAIAYVLAAFLMSRARIVWRLLGALLDAAPSLLVSWALIEEGTVLSHVDNSPFWISIAIAAIWIGALIPVVIGVRPAG